MTGFVTVTLTDDITDMPFTALKGHARCIIRRQQSGKRHIIYDMIAIKAVIRVTRVRYRPCQDSDVANGAADLRNEAA